MPNSKLVNRDRLQFLVAVLTTASTISLSAAATAIVAAHYMDAQKAIGILTLTDQFWHARYRAASNLEVVIRLAIHNHRCALLIR